MKLSRTHFLYILLLLSACKFDPDKFKLPAWNSDVLGPLVKAEYSINDMILENKDYAVINDSGYITLIYKDTIPKVGIENYIKVPDTSISFSAPLPVIPNINQSYQVHISDIDPSQSTGNGVFIPPFIKNIGPFTLDMSGTFQNVQIISGTLDFTITNGFPFDIDAGAVLTLKNQAGGQVILTQSLPAIPQGGVYTLSPPKDLAGTYLEGLMSFSVANLNSQGNSSANLSPTDNLSFAFSLQNLKIQSGRIKFPAGSFSTPPVTYTVSDLPYGIELTDLIIKSGMLNLDFNQQPDVPLTYTFKLLNARHQTTGDTLTLTGTISGTGIFHNEIDISNYKIDFTNNGSAISNTLSTRFELSTPGTAGFVDFDVATFMNPTFSYTGIQPQKVHGYLGYFKDTVEGEIKIRIFDNVIAKEEFDFENPSVTVNVTNSFGVGAKIPSGSFSPDASGALFIQGSNPLFTSVVIGQSLDGLSVAPASYEGELKTTTSLINLSNEPQFSNFIGNFPSTVKYKVPFDIGSPVKNYSQFALDTSGVSGNVQVELPLKFKAKNLVIVDTTEFSLKSQNTYADVVDGNLITYIENGMPVDFDMQAFFLDEGKNIIDSLFSSRQLIQSAAQDAQGKVISPFKRSFTTILDKDRTNGLKDRVKYLAVYFTVNTASNPPGNFVKIYADYKLGIQVVGDLHFHLSN